MRIKKFATSGRSMLAMAALTLAMMTAPKAQAQGFAVTVGGVGGGFSYFSTPAFVGSGVYFRPGYVSGYNSGYSQGYYDNGYSSGGGYGFRDPRFRGGYYHSQGYAPRRGRCGW